MHHLPYPAGLGNLVEDGCRRTEALRGVCAVLPVTRNIALPNQAIEWLLERTFQV